MSLCTKSFMWEKKQNKVSRHSPLSPCSSHAKHSHLQIMPLLHECVGLGKTYVLLVWQRNSGSLALKVPGCHFSLAFNSFLLLEAFVLFFISSAPLYSKESV